PGPRPVPSQPSLAPARFPLLKGSHAAQVRLRDVQLPDQLLVQDPLPARRHGADRHLGRDGRPELARHHDIELGAEPPGDLRRNPDTPTGQAEHEGITATIALEPGCERPTRIPPVAKQRLRSEHPHRVLPCWSLTPAGSNGRAKARLSN